MSQRRDRASQPHSGLTLTRSKLDDREPDKRPLDLGLIRRLLAYMRPHARTRDILLVFVVLRAIQLPLVAWTTGAVINGPITHKSGWEAVALGGAGFLLLAGITQFCFHYRQRLALEIGEAVVHDLRNELFAHLQKMPMSYFNTTKTGRIISRITSDCEALRVGVQDVLFVSLVGTGQMLVAALFMAWYDLVLFGIVLVITPCVWVLNRIFRKRLSRAYRNIQESFSRVTSTLAESVNGVRVTQAFARQPINAALFTDLVVDHSHVNMVAARTSGLFLPALETTSQVFIALLIIVGGSRVLAEPAQMDIAALIQFFFLANIFFSPIQILGNQYNQALTAMAGAERVFGLLDTPPAWSDAEDAVPIGPITGRVEFDRVTFGYDPDRPVLHDISFTAEPGQTVALVGHTGSGKTSIINLVSKFYLPQQGEIRIDGRPLGLITTDSLHDRLGIVLQHNFLFTGSVLDNIRYGRPGLSEEEVHNVLARLDCLDLIAALPQGLHTEVGEKGSGLSLGQKQLVCFARALAADPAILILDEATSAVDTLTEQRLQAALEKLLEGRTSFVVAHRLSTIEKADLVLVLDQGHILERGSHAELSAQNGTYAHLLAQFRGQ
jgi:ATP-binding cassette subfamily B protein